MSFSGRLAYRMLKTTTNIFPFMKTKITDIEKELEKSKKINEKNKFALPSDKKSLYKEINVSGHPCLIIRSKKIENKKDRAILFIYGGITRQWKTELAMARGYGDRIATYSVETPKHIYCPIHMDFNNSPETYMYFAEEACAGNARAYQIAYDRAGVGAKLHIHIQPEMMHGYSSVPVFPESKRSFNEAIKLLNEV